MYVNKKRIVPFKLMEFEEDSAADTDSDLPTFKLEEEE